MNGHQFLSVTIVLYPYRSLNKTISYTCMHRNAYCIQVTSHFLMSLIYSGAQFCRVQCCIHTEEVLTIQCMCILYANVNFNAIKTVQTAHKFDFVLASHWLSIPVVIDDKACLPPFTSTEKECHRYVARIWFKSIKCVFLLLIKMGRAVNRFIFIWQYQSNLAVWDTMSEAILLVGTNGKGPVCTFLVCLFNLAHSLKNGHEF